MNTTTYKMYVAGLFAVVLLSLNTGVAQTKITFRLDISTQIKDSTFVPGTDYLQITGNQIPFTKTRNIKMRPSNQDSIYVAQIQFPSIVNSEILRYSYIIVKPNEELTEISNRICPINRNSRSLPTDYFNIFAN